MSWQRDAEALCRTIMGVELAERSVYVLTDAEAPAWLRAGDSCHGYTSDLLDGELETTLRSAKRWSGRGFATVISATRGGRISSPRECIETTLHELSHYLDDAAIRPRCQSRPLEELAPLLVGCDTRTEPPTFNDWPERAAWHGHGDTFIRACAHVAHRASLAGFKATLSDLGAAGPRYELSTPAAYLAALGDECRQREDEPIIAVLKSMAPTRFSALFARDTELVAA